MASHQFHGTIIDTAGMADLSSLRVDVLDARRRTTQIVASAPVSITGTFSIEVTDQILARAFGDATPLLFFRVSGPHSEAPKWKYFASTERTLQWSADRDAVGRIHIDSGRVVALFPESPIPRYVLQGVASDENGPRAATLTLKRYVASASGVTAEPFEPPVSGVADARGRFKLTYETSVANPDLELTATFTSPDRTAVLRVGRAQPETFVRIVVDAAPPERPTYASLRGELADSGVVPTSMHDQDAAGRLHLATRAAQPVELVNHLAAASALSAEAGVVDGEEIFFGVLRPAEAVTEREVYARGLPSFWRRVDAASTARRIKTFTPGDLASRKTAFKNRAAEALETSDPGRLAIGDLMSTAPELADADKRKDFTKLLLENEGDVEAFWGRVQTTLSLSDDDVKGLRFTATVAPFTGFHKPLVAKFQELRPAGPAPADPEHLATLGADAIDDAIEDAIGGLPPPEQLPPGVASVSAYKASVKAAIESEYRTVWARTALGSGSVKSALLGKPDFRFERTRVSKEFDLDTLGETERAELLQFERMHHVAPSYEVTSKLVSLGFRSANEIHELGRTRFMAMMAAEDVPPLLAKLTFENAASRAHTSKVTQSLFAPTGATGIGNAIPALPSSDVPDSPEAAPDWQTLFGTADSCACAHCQSVYGPNAYLADLLQFLLHQHDETFGNLRSRLFSVRPDLQHLILDCDTATTQLPHIDVVNEILELLVTSMDSSAWPTTKVGTTATAPELGAAPEIKYPTQFVAAYDALRVGKYPFVVPFSLWDVQTDAMLAHLGVRRSRIIEVFSAPTSPTKEAWMWAADMGICLELRTLLLTPLPGDAELDPQYWGFSSTGFLAALAGVKAFMAATQLTFDEVQELAAVSWGGGNFDVTPEVGCDLATLQIANRTRTSLWNLQRFLRLRAVLGFSIDDLAKACLAFFPSFSITDAGLAKLGAVNELVREWKLAVPEAVAIFADLDRDSSHAPSLFRRVFLTKSLHHDPPAILKALDEGGSSVPSVAELRSLTTVLAATLGVDVNDIKLMVDAERAFTEMSLWPIVLPPEPPPVPPPDGPLTRLSLFYRVTKVAAMTHTSVRDILVLRALSPNGEVFGPTVAPSAFRSFLRTVEDVRTGALTVDDILYILRHVVTPRSGFGLDAATLTRMHQEVDAGIAAADKDSERVSDPQGATTQRLLEVIVPGQAVEVVKILKGSSTLLTEAAQRAFLREHLGFLLPYNVELGLASGVAAESLPPETVEDRFTTLAKHLVRYDRARAFVIEWLSRSFGVDAGTTRHLVESGALPTTVPANSPALRAFLASMAQDASTSAPAADQSTRAAILHRFDKIALVIRKLRLSERTVKAMNPNGTPTALPFLSLGALPVVAQPANNPEGGLVTARGVFAFGALLRLVNFARLRDRFPGGEDGLFALFAYAATPGVNPVMHEEAVAKHCGWDRADMARVNALLAPGLTSLAGELPYLQYEATFNLLRRLGTSAAEAITWAAYDAPRPQTAADLLTPSSGSAVAIALAVTRAARSRYDAEGWNAVARPIRDRMRQKQRDVLVAFLIGREPSLSTESDLFKALYLDVLVEPMVLTSRAVAAMSCIQSFVQRGIIGGTLLDADGARAWQWMKSYRVWEANRKVFLYPENYLEPELRKDKSPLFVALEQKLRQGELTYAAAEAAYRTYLGGLAEVQNLEIVAVYNEVLEATPFSLLFGVGIESVTHVFGRTSPPHRLFHRTKRGGRWTPWVNVDVDAPSDHFVVQSHGGRLYLIWLLAETEPDQSFTPTETGPRGQPPTQLFCGLGYSIRGDDGVWGRPISQPRDTWATRERAPVSSLLMNARSNTSGMLEVRLGNPDDAAFFTTVFTLDPCSQVFRLGSETEPTWGRFNFVSNNQQFRSRFTPHELLFEVENFDRPLFAKSRSLFSLAYQQVRDADAVPKATIYRDDRRSFFIERLTTQRFTPVLLGGGSEPRENKFSIGLFMHPYVCTFQTQLANHGLAGLLDWSVQGGTPLQRASRDIEEEYDPRLENIVGPFPKENIDFTSDGAYSVYNWELFFHVPLFIASRLMQEQRFEEAQKWFHYIFDPTDGSREQGMKRFWRVKPFYEAKPLSTLLEDLEDLAEDEWTEEHRNLNTLIGARPDRPVSESFVDQIAAWRDEPFDPHLIAQLRPSAYQKLVFIRYVENLLAWADQLFIRDTLESTNEATNLYLLAQDLLGPRPVTVDRHLTTAGKSYSQLALDELSNAIVTEPLGPLLKPGTRARREPMPTVWRHLYFCVPANDKILGLWDLVEDRLFKLRNALNIEGIERALPLFAPPIDPALLVRAAAAGVDVSAVLNDVGVSPGPYRFTTYLAKAIELAQVVASYGQAYLTALEKLDGEALQNLRMSQEVALQETILEVRKAQVQAAMAEITALTHQRAPVQHRLDFYSGRAKISGAEALAMASTTIARLFSRKAEEKRDEATALALLPSFGLGISGWAASPVSTLEIGGPFWVKFAEMAASGHQMAANESAYTANVASTTASYDLRWDEWKREEKALAAELTAIDKQVAAAELRLAVARAELAATEKQIAQSKEVADFMLRKFTNDQLYEWMKGQLRALHWQAYDLAYKTAKRAERAYQIERADDASFILFGYWDAPRQGLLAGETLLEALRNLEATYYTENKRDLEITKHVSLAKHAPEELLKLRETGTASFRLNEDDFDRDYLTHYLRRIKTASVSLSCATGPHDGVLGTLSLKKGETRRSNGDLDTSFTRVEAIVTSDGREDDGLFELTLRDERLLPFEGIGAHAEQGDQWRFALTDGNEFDYRSISDLILHLRYTARNGVSHGAPAIVPRSHLIPLHTQSTDAWESYIEGTAPDIAFKIPKSVLPARRNEALADISRLDIYVRWTDTPGTLTVTMPGPGSSLTGHTLIGTGPSGLRKWVFTPMTSNEPSPPPTSTTLPIDDGATYHLIPTNPSKLVEAWVIVTYTYTT